MIRYILLLLTIFCVSYHLSAQKIITVGIGYALDEKDRPFYVPIVVRNDEPDKIAAAVGEPIISLDGQNLAFYGEVMRDSLALIAKKKELSTLFGSCTECIFRTVNPATRELRIFDGYAGMFRYASDMNPLFMEEDKLKGNELGFLGLSYKMQLKPNTIFSFRPVIQEIKPESPAEKAGLKVGDELTAIIFPDGIKESLYNTPLLWVIQKMKGPVGTTCTLIINETEKKTLKRANLSGDIQNAQIINHCLSGNCKDGEGKSDNGKERYEGSFVNYKYEGKGKIYKSEKLTYEGEFLAGQKNGVGIDYQFDGTKVETSYIKGKAGNTLKYTKPNGYVYFEVWNGAQKSIYDKNMKPLTASELQQKSKNNDIDVPPPSPEDEQICTYCKGTGKYKQYGTCTAEGCVKGHIICELCKGTGTYKDVKGKSQTCPRCRYVSPEMPHGQNCKVCTGTGMTVIGEKNCAFCKGKGVK